MKNDKSIIDHVAQYLERLTSLNYSPRSVQEEGYTLKRFGRWLEQNCQCVRPDSIRRQHLDGWQKHLCASVNAKGLPIAARTVNKHLTFTRSFLVYLAVRGCVTRGLVDVLERLRESQVLPRGVLTHAQVRRLMDGVDTSTPEGYRNRTILELLYTSGIRARELTGLAVGDLDLDQGTARVLGKGRKERVVPVGKTALRFLRGYITSVRPFLLRDQGMRALFVNAHGDRFSYRSLQHLFGKLHIPPDLKQRVTAHTFRRSCTTELIRGGANVYHVKDLLGHESLRTLKPYTQLTIMDLKKTHGKCHPRERDEND